MTFRLSRNAASGSCAPDSSSAKPALAATTFAACVIAASTCRAQALPPPPGPTAFNLDAVTELAQGAIDGINVETPVPGFELLLMKDGREIYNRSFGLWFNGRKANADSSTKTLSGALIMSLIDSSPNAFSLDTKLSDYIPEFTGEKADITIRQAFSHTSGLGQSGWEGNPNVTLQQAAVGIAALPLEYPPPGSIFAYGGTSMHAAGAVAELAGGKPYIELFSERITGPLGMNDTTFVLTTPDNPRVAGGVESTADDFARFMEALRNGGIVDGTRILSENAVEAMFTRQTPIGIPVATSPLDSADYGVGVWLDERDPDGNLIGALAGGARGFTSWIDFDDGIVGVISTDLTTASNILPVQYLLRAAAAAAGESPLWAGDNDTDGDVDFDDLGTLLGNYGLRNRLYTQGDSDGDGWVSFDDLGRLLGNYGRGTGSALPVGTLDEAALDALSAAGLVSLVPEPSGIAVPLAAALLIGRPRRAWARSPESRGAESRGARSRDVGSRSPDRRLPHSPA